MIKKPDNKNTNKHLFLRITKNTVKIARTAIIHEAVRFYGVVSVGSKAFIGPNCVIGYCWNDEYISALFVKHTRYKHRSLSTGADRSTIIGPEVWLHANCVICIGAKLCRGTWCDAGCFIGERSTVGENTWIHYGARIYNDVVVGSNCNLGGFICNRAIVGQNVTMFGSLIHRLDNGYRRINDRADDTEPSPVVGNDVFIGWGATIIGGVSIGEGARIGAMCMITKDVKPGQRIPAGKKL